MLLKSCQYQQATQKGFTLIELVIVIIVLGVLAATAVPKFSSRSGFEDYTVRDQLISRLRLVQLQGMNADPTNGAINNACYWVVVKSSCFYQDHTTKNGVNCNLPADRVNVCSGEDYNEFGAVKFPTGMLTNASYHFDLNGRLIPFNGQATGIDIDGDNELSITIESEGYIHE
jgi:MSHA pilin protein MshC